MTPGNFFFTQTLSVVSVTNRGMWICQNCYMNLSKFLHETVKVVPLIFMKIPLFSTLIVFLAGYKHCDGQRRSRGDQHKR